jgi:spore coat polysaccharide biosynthesis protein SpsF
MRVLIAIQARSNSERFPNKMTALLMGRPVVRHVYDRCLEASKYKPRIYLTQVAIITPENDPLAAWCIDNGALHYGGSEYDLVDRYNKALENWPSDVLIRVTGDCPVIPVQVITTCMDMLGTYDYVSNTVYRTYPDGYDVQGCSKTAWEDFFNIQQANREHPFRSFDLNECIRDEFEKKDFKWGQMINNHCQNQIKLSIDTPADLEKVKEFYGKNS